MHVGLNLIFLLPGETGGIEVYARELIQSFIKLHPEMTFTAFISTHASGGLDFLDGIPTVSLPIYPRSRTGWIRGEQTLLPRRVEEAGCDLLHNLASTGPVRGRFRRVTTIHDLIYRVLPQYHRAPRYWGPRFLVSHILIPLAARHSDRVITDSRASAADIQRLLKIPSDGIDVIPLGPGHPVSDKRTDADVLQSRLGLGSRPIVLSVSAKWPHKNLTRLIQACALLPDEKRPVVVIPGYPTPHESDLHACARACGMNERLVTPGWLPQEDLEGLYAAAAACVLPSFYEGFGMPALEALSRGVPLLCSSGGAMEEIAGKAALTFDPHSTRELADQLLAVLTNGETAKTLRAAGPKRAAQFSWDNTARATLDTYRAAIQD